MKAKISLVAVMSDVMTACSKKWSDSNLCNCECDSNWMTNMYLDYNNNNRRCETALIVSLID